MERLLAVLAGAAIVATACSGPGAPLPQRPETVTTSLGAPPTPDLTAPGLLPPQDIPAHLAAIADRWETDFSRAVVDLGELRPGLPGSDPRDLIPPIDDPQFEVARGSTWLADDEPGVILAIGEDARFYPLSVLTRHEIVNDIVGDTPVAVTYCPLCNTALVFDRRLGDKVLRLGVSGLLRHSDLVMWDNVTVTLWQQVTGQAIVGANAGKSLERLGSAIVRWSDFKGAHPEGLVLRAEQGFGAVYGGNSYAFYSSRTAPYAFYTGEIDPRHPAMSRVVSVVLDGETKAYPFGLLEERRVVNDEIGGTPVAVFWGAASTKDALDGAVIADGRAIGTAIAYHPVLDGTTLTFDAVSDTEFRDHQTGTTWNILGVAVAGPLEGARLALAPHANEFWFAWQAFFPDGDVWEG